MSPEHFLVHKDEADLRERDQNLSIQTVAEDAENLLLQKVADENEASQPVQFGAVMPPILRDQR